MKFNILSKLLLLNAVVLLGYSCKKIDTPKAMGDAGTTIVKITSNQEVDAVTKVVTNISLAFVDLTPSPQAINLLEVRRDVPNQEELGKTMTLVLNYDFSLVTAYDSDILEAPVGSFTYDAVNPSAGNSIKVTFAPNEFVKYVKINVPNGTVFDPNEVYGAGFTISSVDQGGKISVPKGKVVVIIGAKNRYDGHYVVTGTLTDVQASTITGKYPFEVDLETLDANTVVMYHTGSPFTGYYHPILSAGANSAYGNFAVVIKFNGDKIVDVYNNYGQGTGSRWGFLDPTGANEVDPATKSFKIKYFMNQPDVSTLRTKYDEVFKYIGPR